MKLALCLIVAPTDEEALLLDTALRYTAKHVDGVFITITGENKQVEAVAKKYKATVSHYEWDYNFANARNFNFSQVPKDYTHILWMDADDVFRGIENIRKTIEENPQVDVFVMNYLYAFDEYKMPIVVHLKTQVVKNDGCVTWAGELHEDFQQHRSIESYFVKGIERIHRTNPERIERNTKRNVEVSQKNVQNDPDDPRSYWNLGQSLKGAGRYEEALESYEKFLTLSQSDDEKYMVWLAEAEIYLYKADYRKALDTASLAIGTLPEYPDAYHMKGHIYYAMRDFQNAKDSYMRGLDCIRLYGVPEHKIIVYNPRNYDYEPLMALSRCYLQLDLPELSLDCLNACLLIQPDNESIKTMVETMKKDIEIVQGVEKEAEKLKKLDGFDLEVAIAALPIEFQSHPLICAIRQTKLIKTESSGRDISIVCGYTTEEWTPNTARQKGIGGSEEAVINLSKQLSKKGWNVTVYNNCGYKEYSEDGVVYLPFWRWNYRDKQDVTILWRHVRPVDYEINTGTLIVDLHDVVQEGEFSEKRLEKIDRIFVKSEAQRALYPNIPDEKFAVIPNGVDISLFDQEAERDPYKLVQFSSPDRALEQTLDIVEEVKRRLPKINITFHWYYGWSVFDSSNTSARQQEWKHNLINRFEALKREGWVFGGERINHKQVALENLTAGALVYPSEFFEIDWIGGSKAQIAGCVPITTDFAAIGEKVQHGIKVKSKKTYQNWDRIKGESFGITDEDTKEAYIKALVAYLKNPWDEKKREPMKEWGKRFAWENIAEQWDKELKGLILKSKLVTV